MASGWWDAEWQAVIGSAPGGNIGLTAMTAAVVVAGWVCWRQMARLKAAKLALDERLRLAQNSQAEASQKLSIAEARFQELHARIKSSDGFMSLNSSAGGVARSISDVGKAQQQLAAALAAEAS